MITITSQPRTMPQRSLRHLTARQPNHTATISPHETQLAVRHRNFPNNGVVPQQAAYAIGLLLADLAALLGTADSGACNERLSHGQEANAA